jgi:glycine/D-amino acid oxidase-like deaminating enzyme
MEGGAPDVLVVGGGVAGLCLAMELQIRGARTMCVEQSSPGATCSVSSLGLVYPISPLTAPRDICEISIVAFAGYRAYLDELSERSGMRVTRFEHGLTQVATTDLEIAALRDTFDAYRTIGYSPEWSDTPGDSGRFKQPPNAGLIHPDAMSVDARGLLRALAESLVRSGGTISTMEPVTSLVTAEGHCYGVRTTLREIHAGTTILCTGAWLTDNGAPDGRPLVKPVRGQVLSLVGPPGASPTTALYTENLDVIPRPDRLLIGSTIEENVSTLCTSSEGLDWLWSEFEATFVRSPEFEIVDAWVGIRGRPLDDRPLIGATSIDGLMCFGGHYRNGVYLGPITARLLAEQIVDDSLNDVLRAWSPRRFTW